MILVESITVILEEKQYIFYCQTVEGCYYQKITTDFAEHLSNILSNQKTFYSKLLDRMEFTRCIIKNNNSVILESAQKSDQGTWEEVLPIAIEMNVPIFIHQDLLIVDYTLDKEHQQFVDEMLIQEQQYDRSNRIKKMMESLTQAVVDERFEDAASIRDQINQFSHKKVKYDESKTRDT
ncbi:MAG: UvrB/UvrC motif-containing protein [Brevinema sp.]